MVAVLAPEAALIGAYVSRWLSSGCGLQLRPSKACRACIAQGGCIAAQLLAPQTLVSAHMKSASPVTVLSGLSMVACAQWCKNPLFEPKFSSNRIVQSSTG
jgi:hypothetical protein